MNYSPESEERLLFFRKQDFFFVEYIFVNDTDCRAWGCTSHELPCPFRADAFGLYDIS